MGADALRGLDISSVFECPNAYCTMKGDELDPDDPGVFAVLLDELAERAGFNWRDSYALTDPKQMGEKGFTELLAWSVEKYDIAVSWWTETTSRIRQGIDFPEGWYEADIILVGKIVEDDTTFEIDAFLMPFTLELWMMIVITIVVSGLVFHALERLGQRSDRRTLEKSYTNNVFLAFIAFTGRVAFHPRTKVAQVFSLSLAFWAMIVAVSYTANLASAFVVKNTSGSQVQSVEDAVALGHKICVWDSTAADKILSHDFRGGRFVRKREEAGALQGLLNGECKYAAIDKGTWETQKQDPAMGCKLEWVGRRYKEIPAGFATRHDSGEKCSSLISEVLSIYFRDMIQDGFVKRAWEDHIMKLDSQASCFTEANEEDSADKQRLTLKGMGGIFLFHGIVCILSLAYTLLAKFTCAAEKVNEEPSVSETTQAMSDCGFDNPSLSAVLEMQENMVEMRQHMASILSLLNKQQERRGSMGDISA